MAFGEARHRHSESRAGTVAAGIVEPLDRRDEIRCVREVAGSGTGLRIATKRQHVAHAGFRVPSQDAVDLSGAVPHAGQVRHRIEARVAPQPHDEVVGLRARGSASAIGHGDEARGEGLALGDGREEGTPSGLGAGRKYSKLALIEGPARICARCIDAVYGRPSALPYTRPHVVPIARATAGGSPPEPLPA